MRKKLRANARSNQKNGGERHADEKFYLMMQQAAIVKKTDDRQQRGAGQDSDDLLQRRVMPREQHGENEAQINGDAAEQRDGIQMNFARPGFIHHPVAQRQMANGHGEAQRCEQRDGEGDQFSMLRHCSSGSLMGLGTAYRLYDGDETFKLINSSIFGRRFPCATLHFGQARWLRTEFADRSNDGGGIVGIRSQAAPGFDDNTRRVRFRRRNRQ